MTGGKLDFLVSDILGFGRFMKYSKVYIDSIGYEIAPVVVSSAELETTARGACIATLHLSAGQLEALTGIVERRWWEEGHRLSDGAFAAARRALEASTCGADQIEVLIYGGVCREHFEPATACRVGALLGVGPETAIHDVSNACLGVLTGMVEIANRIELGQIRAGMVVSCETAREINEIVIDQMLENQSMDFFKLSLATLTGGSGAVAVLLTDGSLSASKGRQAAGRRQAGLPAVSRALPLGHRGDRARRSGSLSSVHRRPTRRRCSPTASSWASRPGGTSRGVSAGSADQVDKVICHQVGSRIERRS